MSTTPFYGESRPPLLEGETLEPLSRNASIIVGRGHTFNTDTILLAAFSMPHRGEHCADFGAGCGTIPLVWCARSEPAQVHAVELQEAACDMIRRSVACNHWEEKICVVPHDIKALKNDKALPIGLDLIACNPPYKPEGTGIQSRAESATIARHEVACSLSDIAEAASYFLRWGGRFCCCMRPERLCDTLLILRAAGLEPKRLRFVQQRKDKAPFLFLLQCSRGGKPGLQTEPVLLVESEDGGWSREILEIYGDYKEGHV